MPTLITSAPQQIIPINRVSLLQVLPLLPMTSPYPVNIWIAGKLALYGITTETIQFVAQMADDPPPEMKQYFNSLIQPKLGLAATVLNNWRQVSVPKLPLYSMGNRVLNDDGFYTQAMQAVLEPTEMTVELFLSQLPPTIPYPDTVSGTGSLFTKGFSFNDADTIAGEFTTDDKMTVTMTSPATPERCKEIQKYLQPFIKFDTKVKCKLDVGPNPMPEREPGVMMVIYRNGKLSIGG